MNISTISSSVDSKFNENTEANTTEGIELSENFIEQFEDIFDIYNNDTHFILKRYYFVDEDDNNSSFSYEISGSEQVACPQQDFTRDLIFFTYVVKLMKKIFSN